MSNFDSILHMLYSGVVVTMNQITALLAHFNALDTIVILVLLCILVKRLFRKYIGISGSSDMASPNVSAKSSGNRYTHHRGD